MVYSVMTTFVASCVNARWVVMDGGRYLAIDSLTMSSDFCTAAVALGGSCVEGGRDRGVPTMFANARSPSVSMAIKSYIVHCTW